jgi:hypothetical protein
MDISALAPDLGKLLGINPSTLVLLLFIANVAARAATRSIPNDATGFWAFVRQICAIIGVEVSSKITSGVSVADVAAASLKTGAADAPPVTDKLTQEKQP